MCKTDVRDLIVQELQNQERNLHWLSKKTGIIYSTMYSMFTQRLFMPSAEKLEVINKVLGTNFKL